MATSALPISRYTGEGVKINGPCEIRIQRVRGDKITLLVIADTETYVARSEIYDPAFETMTPEQRTEEGERRRAAKAFDDTETTEG